MLHSHLIRVKLEIRDPKTGDILRYNADDDNITLGEMLRQEKFGGGMADQKNLDAELAKAIMGDGKFENDLEYMDDNAEKLGRKKMRSDAMKRQFAINGELSLVHFFYHFVTMSQIIRRRKRFWQIVSFVTAKTTALRRHLLLRWRLDAISRVHFGKSWWKDIAILCLSNIT